MKKALSVTALVFFLIKLYNDLFYDFMPAMLSNETVAYKAGFACGIVLVLLATIGYGVWAYQLFTLNDEEILLATNSS